MQGSCIAAKGVVIMRKRFGWTPAVCAVLLAAVLAGCGAQSQSAAEATSSLPPQSALVSASTAQEPAGSGAPGAQSAAPDASEPEAALSGTLQEDALAPAGQASSVAGAEETAAQTAYGSGLWYVYAERDGENHPDTQQLQFQDGKLLIHFYSLNGYGKGGYGEGCSDELEFSPYVQCTLEEAVELLEGEGYTVSVQQ